MPTAQSEELYQKAKLLLRRRRYGEALALYDALGDAGDPRCKVVSGWMHFEGLGTRRDPDRAAMLFNAAAAVGSREGAFYCGKLAITQKSYGEALTWFSKAAAHEYSPALLWLGLLHIRGLGVPVDVPKGLRYLERSARLGNYPARRELAVRMIKGHLGLVRIPAGLFLFVYAVASAMISGLTKGDSEELMG
jgi:TPR repeat protein